MTNEDRIYRLCECLIDVIDRLPTTHADSVKYDIQEIMRDIEEV